jgi:hypothetical protein
MKIMNSAVAVFFGSMLLVGVTGCGKSKALLAAEAYQAETCACKDAACVAKAAQNFATHSAEMATARSSEAEAITNATSAAAQCATKAAMAGVPGMPAVPGK